MVHKWHSGVVEVCKNTHIYNQKQNICTESDKFLTMNFKKEPFWIENK